MPCAASSSSHARLGDASAATAVLLGQVHPQEAGRAEFLVQLGGLLVRPRALQEVREAVTVDDCRTADRNAVSSGVVGTMSTIASPLF